MKFEQSKFDKDKGVKEGSAADKKRDAKEKKEMPAAGIKANHGQRDKSSCSGKRK